MSNSLHYTYHPFFADLLHPGGVPRKLVLAGPTSVEHKVAVLQKLLFSEEARARAREDPHFAQLTQWGQHAYGAAKLISTAMRATLVDKMNHVEQMLFRLATPAPGDADAPAAKASNAKRRVFSPDEQLAALRELKSELDRTDWVPLVAMNEMATPRFAGTPTASYPVLNVPAGRQQYMAALEDELAGMMALEATEGLCMDGAWGSIVKGLLCLTKVQSTSDASIESYGNNYWIVQLLQASLCRVTNLALVDNKINFDAGRPIGQKATRPSAEVLWAGQIRGFHNTIGQRVCVLVVRAIRGRMLKRYNDLRDTRGGQHLRALVQDFDVEFVERPAETARTLQNTYGVSRHGSSDAKVKAATESRASTRAKVKKPEAGVDACVSERHNAWCEKLILDGRRSGIGMAFDRDRTKMRLATIKATVYQELCDVELNHAISSVYEELYSQQKDLYMRNFASARENEKNSMANRHEFAGNAMRRLLLADEHDETGADQEHLRIIVEASHFAMHSSPQRMELYGTDASTPLPSRFIGKQLVFRASQMGDGIFLGSFESLFGRSGQGGSHGTSADKLRWRQKQAALLDCMKALKELAQQLRACPEPIAPFAVPPVLASAAPEPDMAALWPLIEHVDKHEKDQRTALSAVDACIGFETPKRMGTRILQAWQHMTETTRQAQASALLHLSETGVQPTHNFAAYVFLFETLCFASMASDSLSITDVVKCPVVDDGCIGFPQIVSPLNEETGELCGWAERDWPLFCAIAEAAVRSFSSRTDTLLASTGSVVEVTTDGRFVVHEERQAILKSVVQEHMSKFKSVYGETRPQTIASLCGLVRGEVTLNSVLKLWLSWNEQSTACRVYHSKEAIASLPLPHRSTRMRASSSASHATDEGGQPLMMLAEAARAQATKAQVNQLIAMSKLKIHADSKKRKAEQMVTAEDLFGSDVDDEE